MTLTTLYISSNDREEYGEHEHESYYGDRDTDSLVKVCVSVSH